MDALTKQVQQLGINGSKKESTVAVTAEEPVLVSAVNAQSYIQWLNPFASVGSKLVHCCRVLQVRCLWVRVIWVPSRLLSIPKLLQSTSCHRLHGG